MIDVPKPPKLLAGGEGLVATTMDYARFAQILLNGGVLDGVRLLGPKTVAYMASDHLGSLPGYSLSPSSGFGLGFALRLTLGIGSIVASVDEYSWTGYAGTVFWVNPKEDMFVVFMLNDVTAGSGYYATLLRSLVYQAIIK